MAESGKIPLLGMTLDKLKETVLTNGLPAFAATQIARWLYQKGARSIDEMTNLSKKARAALAEKYCVGRQEPITSAISTDGTVKYLFAGAGDRDVEAVYIPDRDRATLCVSSQAGCRMGCVFCMTGRQGFHGQLGASAIINQILTVDELARKSQDKGNESEHALTNIVFMGMGEPLDNLDAVLDTIDILTSKWGLAWSPKRITVSTIGKIPALKRLIESTKVHIAVSVHSPVPARREKLMPVERAFPVRDVMTLLRGYDFAHQRRLSVEYIMWKGVNDSLHDADTLARLIAGTAARVNIIRFHAIPESDLRPTSMETMEAFRDRLNALGVTATIRASRGEDIMAACGMLAGKHKNQKDQLT
ncbi:MAG: 23S rRNA (adenine(2503)-C(2))-methyltransferase RlmN [Muribaculaceae bacterium]|nr:23S rRNA (adenine(2503)-C(2))-methyltransferase RlmN [Muribaculaceae bacterium]